MKKITTYVILCVATLVITSCGHTTITTPKKDAQCLAYMAQSVSSEAELREVEKLATEIEIAYRRSYNGAKALEFKALAEPILIEAGNQREIARAEEDYLAEQQAMLTRQLTLLDDAWSLELRSKEEELATIEANNAERATIETSIMELTTEKEALALAIVEAGYPAEMLDKLGEIDRSIEALNNDIAAIELRNHIICLAYKLQLGEELIETFTPDHDTELYDTAQ